MPGTNPMPGGGRFVPGSGPGGDRGAELAGGSPGGSPPGGDTAGGLTGESSPRGNTGGYWERALVVDVTDGSAATLPLPESVLRGYLGGAGLGTWLMHRLCPPGVDPLGPDAPLAFVFSPLVGTPLTTSAKFAVVAKSPLTGMLTDALASSHFAIAGKLTGHDAIVVRGRAARLSVLLIDGDGARLADGGQLAGLTAAEAEARLRDDLGRGWRIAAIGPAGERGVRYATISHDGRHAGRGGLGAVLGAKNLKAVAVRAAGKVPAANPEAVLAMARDLRSRSFGPATAKYRELGTLANLLAYNAISALPTRNFQAASFEGAARLTDEPNSAAAAPAPAGEPAAANPALPSDIEGMRRMTRSGCASCTIGCEHIYRVGSKSGPDAKGGPVGHKRAGGEGGAGRGKKTRAEYQNVYALGPLCGVDDFAAVLAASALCDELGIDTISAGGTIAWAMECAQRGLIDAPWLRFGDPAALLRALTEIGERRTPLGVLLGEGSRSASRTVGAGSEAFALHVKGLEMPGYEPRTMHAMALGLAVNARGADHNRSGAYEADLSGDLDRLAGGDEHATAAIETEDRAAVMDSMILCNFLRGVFTSPFEEWAALLAGVTGWDMNGEELRATARRIVAAKRAFNVREGWQPADDWLPERLLSEPLTLPSGREARLTPERLHAMIAAYYKARGLDADGYLTPTGLAGLNLPDRQD
jgi:aldehyde:ferredoxin oxidoreductase